MLASPSPIPHPPPLDAATRSTATPRPREKGISIDHTLSLPTIPLSTITPSHHQPSQYQLFLQPTLKRPISTRTHPLNINFSSNPPFRQVSGAVIDAFDARIHAMNHSLVNKLDAVERLAQEAKKLDKIEREPRRKASKYIRCQCCANTPSQY